MLIATIPRSHNDEIFNIWNGGKPLLGWVILHRTEQMKVWKYTIQGVRQVYDNLQFQLFKSWFSDGILMKFPLLHNRMSDQPLLPIYVCLFRLQLSDSTQQYWTPFSFSNPCYFVGNVSNWPRSIQDRLHTTLS